MDDVSNGQSVDILVETVVWDPKGLKHLVRSALHRRFLRVCGEFPQAVAYSLMDFTILSTDSGITVGQGDGGVVFPHVVATLDDLFTVTEVCSGIGVMSDGILTSGATICAKNELRETLVDFQMRQGVTGLVQGDIGNLSVLSTFFHQHPRPALLAAGFSCQPWSKLGDKQGFRDSRACSLHHTLRTAYFCRAHGLLLECVTEAGHDKSVIGLIQAWCKCTGFHMHSTDLRLEDFWPSKRHRWWCLILNPAVKAFELRSLPRQVKQPVVNDLVPFFPAWSSEEEQQLSLDLYETNKFIEFQSFDRAIIKGNEPVSTALHGWSNQLQGCPCGCRKSSMDHSRLAKRGIFGALVVMEGHLESCQGQLTRTRHLHPWELSVLAGAIPGKKWLPCLRLGICGLGQMASPIQSAWMYGQYQYEVGKQLGYTDLKSPETVLWEFVQQIFDSFDRQFPEIFQTPSVTAFVSQTFDLLWAGHMETVVPSAIPNQSPLAHAEHESKPPVVQDTDPSYLDSTAFGDEKPEDENPPSLIDDGYADPEWECPFNDCCICDSKLPILSPNFEDTAHLGLTENDSISPTIPFDVQLEVQVVNPFNKSGGVLAFSSKRSLPDAVEPDEKHQKVDDIQSKHHMIQESANKAGCFGSPGNAEEAPWEVGTTCWRQADQEGEGHLLTQVDEAFSQKVQHTIRDQENLVATGVDAHQIPHETGTDSTIEAHHVQVFYPWSSIPSFIKIKKDVTIGCIEVAESNMGNVYQPVRTNNIVGVKLPIASKTDPFQQLIMHYAPTFKHGPIEHGPNWPFDENMCFSRVELLFRQEGWVAQDEMNYYLGVLEAAGLGQAKSAYIMNPDSSPLEDWIHTCISDLQVHRTIFSALLVDSHWIPIVFQQTTQGIQVFSTRQGLDMIDAKTFDDVEFGETFTPQRFHADCGFQTVGAIIQTTTDPSTNLHDVPKTFPIDSATAVVWKEDVWAPFVHHRCCFSEMEDWPIGFGRNFGRNTWVTFERTFHRAWGV